MNKKLCLFIVLALTACSSVGKTEKEERRRADSELQSVMGMVTSRQVPPVEFEFNSASLKSSSFELLDKVARILEHYPRLKLIVEGHTDDVGGEEYNQKLSLLRADSIKTYLVRKGIYPDTIRIVGYGKSRPVINEKTDKARALNRRVEFKITTRDWASVY